MKLYKYTKQFQVSLFIISLLILLISVNYISCSQVQEEMMFNNKVLTEKSGVSSKTKYHHYYSYTIIF